MGITALKPKKVYRAQVQLDDIVIGWDEYNLLDDLGSFEGLYGFAPGLVTPVGDGETFLKKMEVTWKLARF